MDQTKFFNWNVEKQKFYKHSNKNSNILLISNLNEINIKTHKSYYKTSQ
jgi:hypothetical protein